MKKRGQRFASDEMDMDPEAQQGNPHARKKVRKKKKAPRVPKWVYRVIIILVVCVLGLLAWFNRENLTPTNIAEWVQSRVVGLGIGDGFPAGIKGSDVKEGNFLSVNQDLVVVSDTALTVLNSTAKEMISRQHSFNEPVVKCSGSRIMLYNLGGTGYQIEGYSKTLIEDDMDQKIVCGDIAQNGRFVLVTEATGYCSQLTAFLNDNEEQYTHKFMDYYVTGVALNQNGTKAAVTAVSAKEGALSSVLYLLDFGSVDPVAVVDLGETLYWDVSYGNNGRVIAVGDNKTIFIDDNGQNLTEYSYQGQQVAAYVLEKERVALALVPFQKSSDNTLVVLDGNAQQLTQQKLSAQLDSISMYGDTIAALAAHKVYSYAITAGTQIGVADAGTDSRGIAVKDESSAYILGIREIRQIQLEGEAG